MKKSVRIVTVVGARPQFIKAAVMNKAVGEHNRQTPDVPIDEILVHTGQHYDEEMSQVFFDQLEIPRPAYNLGVGSGKHGEQTARMLVPLEEVLLKERPDSVVVYGDTNSTLAGALAAAKLNVPVAHVEAGLRSRNRAMPEEVNRIVADRLASLLFCPTAGAVENLKNEGILQGVHNVGDVMLDAYLIYRESAVRSSSICDAFGLRGRPYCLATVHRQENADSPSRLLAIFSAFLKLADAERPFIIPLHPRTRKALQALGSRLGSSPHVMLAPPANYLDMIALTSYAQAILTDSGGVQREAYFARVPCVTLRDETEWTETVESGWNIVAGTETEAIVRAFEKLDRADLPEPPPYFGDGRASERIVKILSGFAQ
jgi:UDP-GlcNAc3NAcA epimerase